MINRNIKKVTFTLIALALLFTLVLSGCGTTGIPQADYDKLQAQLADVQAQLTKALNDLAAAQKDTATADALKAAQAQVTDLEKQVAALKAQYEYVGLTTAEIVEKVIQNYHATHTYSQTDMFICGDMSSEVWNILKALGISSVIVIGNKDATVADILLSNHAWVLADIGGGEKLALETTAGIVIPRSQNANYYRGWSFTSPTDLKSNNDLIKEYNIRVGFRNLLVTEVNSAMNLYNNSSTMAEADKYLELYNKLKSLKDAQETILLDLKTQIDGLATPFP